MNTAACKMSSKLLHCNVCKGTFKPKLYHFDSQKMYFLLLFSIGVALLRFPNELCQTYSHFFLTFEFYLFKCIVYIFLNVIKIVTAVYKTFVCIYIS